MRVGEKNRRVAVSFGAEAKAKTPSRRRKRGVRRGPRHEPALDKRTISYGLAGLGAAALGSFAFFAITGKSDENDLHDSCSPNCPEDDVDAVRTKYLVADISLGVGIASLGAATWLFFVTSPATKPPRNVLAARRPNASRRRTARARGGAFLGVVRRFSTCRTGRSQVRVTRAGRGGPRCACWAQGERCGGYRRSRSGFPAAHKRRAGR